MGGMDQFKDLWVQTARERIQTLSDLLLKLEKNPGELEIINELMRAGHSLKGESGAMGYEQIAILAHVIEDLFTGMGKGEISISADIMDQLLAALDIITQSVDSIEANGPESNTKEVVDKLKALTGLKTEGFGKTDKSKSVTDPASPTATDSTPSNDVSGVPKTDEQAPNAPSVSTTNSGAENQNADAKSSVLNQASANPQTADAGSVAFDAKAQPDRFSKI